MNNFEMQNYKIIVSYDGTDFNGWQVQPNVKTICSTLQTTFYSIFGKEIKILGASRTDAGVHAFGQVASFKTDLNLDSNKIMTVWNNALPQSILVRNLQEVGDEFNPLVGVRQKSYYYDLFLSRPSPFISRYGFYYEFINYVNFKIFEEALQFYVGKHDFASFCKVEKGEKKDTIRTIDSISIQYLSFESYLENVGARAHDLVGRDMLRVIIIGKSFLRFQIRRMIGYALDVARRSDLSVDYIEKILNNPDPRQKLLKADAKGLCLREIIYE